MSRIAIAALSAALLMPTAGAASPPPEVVRTPVEFRVVNRNGTALPCSADGRAYRVRGELVMPKDADRDLVTVALHEFSFGRHFWSFPDRPDHDIAASMAQAGHAWLIVDRLGYDASDHPPGGATCLGAQADIAAQLVRAVVSGDYRFGAHSHGPAFRRVVLAGHSVGAGIAELAAHSFPSLPLAGLIAMAWADQGYSTETLRQSAQQAQDCAGGGAPAEPGAPSGYAFFGRTPADFRRNMFFDADPAVVSAASAMRNRDPCGDNASLARLSVVNSLGVRDIEVPVLLLYGARDPVFTTDASRRQAAAFSSSSQVEVHTVARAAHALTLERTAPLVRHHVVRWLAAARVREGRGTLDR